MKVQELDISKLIPYARNARTHSEAQIAQIAASIREFGFTNPVLIDKDDGIIAGHGRVLAARKLGLNKIPCIRLPNLSETQKKAYIIADNKLTLNGGWDIETLKNELEALKEAEFDLEITGFDLSILDGEYFHSDEEDEEEDNYREPSKTDEGYVEFSLVVTAEDKKTIVAALNKVKEREGLDSFSQALMVIIHGIS